jgi:archaellum component FlaF (FlaF/FlaG flagellin family)
MKQIFILFIVFFLSACSSDYPITVTVENNSENEISGDLYVAKDILLDNISISPNTKTEYILSYDTIFNSMKKQDNFEGNLEIITKNGKQYVACGYTDYDVCGKTSFYMTIKEDMSYEVEYK